MEVGEYRENCFQAESILECLEVCKKYEEMLDEHATIQAASGQTIPPPALHPLMMAYNASSTLDFFLETVKRIRSR